MCRLLVDTMVWNYVAKAGVLPEFINSIGSVPVVTPLVVREVEKALPSWPELGGVTEAARNGAIELVELDETEHVLLYDFHCKHSGLSETDCSLLALAISRGWEIATCERSLKNAAQRYEVAIRELADLVDEAVAGGCISSADRDWITYYSRGGTQRRTH